MKKIDLYVQFSQKEEAKTNGALWDVDNKLWYCYKDNKYCIDNFRKIYINVPYEKKDYAKTLGAKYDGKMWYCSVGHKILIEEFSI